MSGEIAKLSPSTAGDQNYESDAFEARVIYVYEHVDVIGHKGWLKVGQTKRSRIRGDGGNLRIEEQHEAANIEYRVLYVTDAVTNQGSPFSDHDVHRELTLREIPREDTRNPRTNRKSEWFQTELATVVQVIEDLKAHAQANSDGIVTDFTLRNEQEQAVETTAAYFAASTADDSTLPTEFLWNAKPRFGKTLTSYVFAREIRARKVLVLTNRPAVADSWFNDFIRFDFLESGQDDGKHRWLFTASDAVRNRLSKPAAMLTRDKYIEQLSGESPVENFVHFISLQDIRGKDAINKYKGQNSWIFRSHVDGREGINWDLIIIDESHEGVETERSLAVLSQVNHDFALHLSGTPFKALASNKFDTKQIFNWSYSDEQLAKAAWNLEDGENPYGSLPKLNIFTYQLSNALRLAAEEAKADGSDYAFDLGEFFRVSKVAEVEQFVHHDKVVQFVNRLADENGSYPYSDISKLDTVRHTFWLLPGVKECVQLKKILEAHPFFGEFDIILAAGNGDEDKLTKSALDAVRLRINGVNGSKHPLESKTITLSCGQLTTGVTVPEWTSVFMLNNIKSPAVYMQTAFRAQNPFEVATSGGEKFVKENCFVFDFAPDRILTTIAELADGGSSDPSISREEKVRILINFLPVIAEDEDGSLRELNANDVLTMPLKMVAQEVVSRGFMSNRLFTNIGSIFGAPDSVLAIINKMAPEDNKKKGDADKDKVTARTRIWADKDNKIHINEDIIINTQNGLFSDKKYVDIGSDDAVEVKSTLDEAKRKLVENNVPSHVAEPLLKRLEKMLPKIGAPLPGTVEEPKVQPDSDPTKSEQSEEEKVRDRLRGFARTIPSFLMAYGDSTTTIDNFEANIPDETFVELTSITKAEFVQLRDGFEFTEVDKKTGTTISGRFEGLFNKAVFNSSIQEFNGKRADLADYYLAESRGDIFQYIPPQQTNQIFTPIAVVKMILDRLENANPSIFTQTDSTFIDLYMKSGLFITETAKRLFANTRQHYSSDFECIKHILEKQLYGLAPTSVLHAITNSFIFGFDESHRIDTKNFIQHNLEPDAANGTAAQKVYELFGLEGDVFKFDAVVGNPPYQDSIGKTSSQSKGNTKFIYYHFQNAADKMARSTSLIFPFGGWFDKRTAFGNFGERLLSDGHTVSIDAFEGSKDKRVWMRDDIKPNPIFGASVDLSAGVAIVVRDMEMEFDRFTFSNRVYSDLVLSVAISDWRDLGNDTSFSFANKLGERKLVSRLTGAVFDIDGGLYGENIQSVKEDPASLEQPVMTFANNTKGSGGRTKKYWVERKSFTKNQTFLDKFKVLAPSAFPKQKFVTKGTDFKSVAGRLEGLLEIVDPPSAYGGSRICVFSSESRTECQNFLVYASTRFFAYLVTVEPNARSSIGQVIPDQDFSARSDIDWSKPIEEIDQQLCKKYNLSKDEIELIMTRP